MSARGAPRAQVKGEGSKVQGRPVSARTFPSHPSPDTSRNGLGQWRRQLDKLLRAKTPLGLKDFPQLDEDIQDAFAEGLSPEAYFEETVRHELEDLGFPYEDFDAIARAVEFAREGDGESVESLLLAGDEP
jgi:hypothetical protein